MKSNGILIASLLVLELGLAGCDKKEGGKESQTIPAAQAGGASKGVGPIQSIQLDAELDSVLVAKGEKLFSGTCVTCHKLDIRFVGPALNGVTTRRSPEWIMNMMLNPSGMTQQDDTAKALLAIYMIQMSVAVTQEDARAALEFFRKNDASLKNHPVETPKSEKK
jgi:mono/diheme cytochrome c family protein